MNISKPVKILISVLTVFAVLFLFFIIFFIFSFSLAFFTHQSVPNPNDIDAIVIFTSVLYTLMLGLQIFYIIHEIRNKALTHTFRILFVIGTFLLPYIAMPIYLFGYLWEDSPH